jgi:hypothetical protein
MTRSGSGVWAHRSCARHGGVLSIGTSQKCKRERSNVQPIGDTTHAMCVGLQCVPVVMPPPEPDLDTAAHISAQTCNKGLTMRLKDTIANGIRSAFTCFCRAAESPRQNQRGSFRFATLAAIACVALVQGPAMARDRETTAPLVWFAPQAPGIWPDGRTGVVDFIDLFTPSAPWSVAASHIKVFKIANSEFLGNLPGVLTTVSGVRCSTSSTAAGLILRSNGDR